MGWVREGRPGGPPRGLKPSSSSPGPLNVESPWRPQLIAWRGARALS